MRSGLACGCGNGDIMKIFVYLLEGFLTGCATVVPGVSGGSAAIAMGIYDRLILALAKPKSDLKFLLSCGAGGAAALLLLFPVAASIIKDCPAAVRIAVTAIIAVSTVLQAIRTVKKGITASAICAFLCCAAVPALINAGMKCLFLNIGGTLYILAAGCLLSAALVLPGLSFTYMLYFLGLYVRTADALKAGDMAFLLPLGAGLALGSAVCVMLTGKVIESHPKLFAYCSLGFLTGCLGDCIAGLLTIC